MLDRVDAPAALAEAEAAEQRPARSSCCASTGKRPWSTSCRSPARSARRSAGRAPPSAARRPRAPRPSSSRLEVVEQRVVGLVHLEARGVPRRSSTLRSRCGRKSSKSWCGAPRPRPGTPRRRPGPAPRAARAGTRSSLSRSRRMTRIRLASSESWSSDSSYGRSSSSSAPSSSETTRSWTSFETVASCCGRTPAAVRRHHRLLVPGGDRAELGEIPGSARRSRSSA